MSRKKIEIILKKTIPNLGSIGQVVKVASGYFLNYLLPNGYAAHYKEEIKQSMEKMFQEKLQAEKENREKLTKALGENCFVTINAFANNNGNLYGRISGNDIIQKVNEKYKLNLLSSNIQIDSVIKTIGDYNVKLSAYGTMIKLKVQIVLGTS